MTRDRETDDDAIEQLAHARRRGRGLRVAARRALVLARRYRTEEGPRGQREVACVRQALAWRAAAKDVVAGELASSRPGLARASVPPSDAADRGRRSS